MTAELTPEQAELVALARAQAVEAIRPALQAIDSTMDRMVQVGFGIPAPAVDALLTLTAFGVALAANAAGQPCPAYAAERLGLNRPDPDPLAANVCPDCRGVNCHAPWCPE